MSRLSKLMFLFLAVTLSSTKVASAANTNRIDVKQMPVDMVLTLDQSTGVPSAMCVEEINELRRIIKDQHGGSTFSIIRYGETIDQKELWVDKEGAVDILNSISCTTSMALGHRNSSQMLRYSITVLQGKERRNQKRTKMLVAFVNGPSNYQEAWDVIRDCSELTYALSLATSTFPEVDMIGTTPNHVFYLNDDAAGKKEAELLKLIRIDSSRICPVTQYYDDDFQSCEDCDDVNICKAIVGNNRTCSFLCPYYKGRKLPVFKNQTPKEINDNLATVVKVVVSVVVISLGGLFLFVYFWRRWHQKREKKQSEDKQPVQECNQHHSMVQIEPEEGDSLISEESGGQREGLGNQQSGRTTPIYPIDNNQVRGELSNAASDVGN